MTAPVTARGPRLERLERAHHALVQAETAAGVRHVDWAAAAPPRSQPLGGAVPPSSEAGRFDGHWLPLPHALQSIVPHGALRRGSTCSVTGSTVVLVQMASALARDGLWTAVVAQPDLGLAAVVEAGLDPARLVLVPDPGPAAAEVVAAVIDGFDVVVVGRCEALSPRDRRSLSGRARHRGATLLSSTPWPGAEVSLEVVDRAWTGIREVGRLTGGRVLVRGDGRGSARAGMVAITVEEHTVAAIEAPSAAGRAAEALTHRRAG